MQDTEKFKISKEKSHLQENVERIYRCRGRIKGSHPVSIPPDSLLADKFVFQAHKDTFHREVVLTMTNIRSNYWIPIIRKLVKSVVSKCYVCKRFNLLPCPGIKSGPLPNDRTEQVISNRHRFCRSNLSPY